MNPLELYQKVLNQRLNELETDQLEAWIRQYPYFALPYFVKARQTKDQSALFEASLYAANRFLLKRFMDGTIILQEQNFQKVIEAHMKKSARPFSLGENDTFSIVNFDALHPSVEAEEIPFYHQENRRRHVDNFLNWEIKVRTLKYLPLVATLDKALQENKVSSPPASRPTTTSPSAQSMDILNRFLENTQAIKREPPGSTLPPDASVLSSLEEDDEVVSETLAHIHLMQKNYDEAIRIYQKLSLLFPEKKAYFANQIEMIKNS